LDNMAESFFVARSCTVIIDEQRLTEPLAAYRDRAAWVLLGDSGAGKTTAFKQEAMAVGGEYITARDFCAIGPKEDGPEQVLFIDGLDEMRVGAGDGNTALDQIRRRLKELKRPRFRLSCREADWLGASDAEALKQVSPDQQVIALHLNPLTEQDIADILKHKASVADAEEFVRQARQHGLEELLHNPQTLNLLVDAVAGNDQQWPQSRSQVYEMACQQLIREPNKAHRDVKKKANTISDVTWFDGAGYLCAVQLLAGVAGFALDDDAVSAEHVRLQDLANPDSLPLQGALATNLFQGAGDGQERRIPIHRSVAEYLGARYIARAIDTRGLPIGRVIALMSGDDGGVVPDLRGLAAWLAWHCRTARAQLIECDALGVVLYGDVKQFPVEDKKLVLMALHDEAARYPWFRASEGAAHRFGALGGEDMMGTFMQMLAAPSRTDADQGFLLCILDAIRYGEPMPHLVASLASIIRDASYDPEIRLAAINARMHCKPHDDAYWIGLVTAIQKGEIEDRDDELLGNLLQQLYPVIIPPEKILDFLSPQKNNSRLGEYFMFWLYKLPTITPKDKLPLLVAQIKQRKKMLEAFTPYQQLQSMIGEVLLNCLMVHGDTVTDGQLYAWLDVGIDSNRQCSRLDPAHADLIREWLEQRPARYKAILMLSATFCNDNSFQLSNCPWLYGANPPPDIVEWYLASAAEKDGDVARFFFEQAVLELRRQGGQDYSLSASLEYLEPWLQEYPNFRQYLERYVSRSIASSPPKSAIEIDKGKAALREKKKEWADHFIQHHASILDGSAPAGILYQLSLVYKGNVPGAHGTSPQERLRNFFDGDAEMVAAVLACFRRSLSRDDLPSVADIIKLAVQGQMYNVSAPCLIGMDEFYQADPMGAIALDDAILARLVAFRLSGDIDDDRAWFVAMLQARPELLAPVFVTYVLAMLRARKEWVTELDRLVNREGYAKLARIALPELLQGFPKQVTKNQLGNSLDPLLKGALRYLDHQALVQLIAKKIALKSLDDAQRVYWLACGLLIQPDLYEEKLIRTVGQSEARMADLAQFFEYRHRLHMPDPANLPVRTMLLLIELLAPDYSPEQAVFDGKVSRRTATAALMRTLINTLGADPSASATQALEDLLTLPKLASWHNTLRGALHAQRITRRKASFSPVGSVEVSRMLANLQPASAADLAALVFDHLRDIARKIRDGNTDDYIQYWNYYPVDTKKSTPNPENSPKHENICRDALLSDLERRLLGLGIDAQPERPCADNNRSDIDISFNTANPAKRINVPIEIKKDSHPDLWKAIHTQLIPCYVRDPGTAGQGIYLVFWFGGKGMPLPPDAKRPKSAKELEERLRGLLTAQERYHIHVCVIDCALPPPGKGDSSKAPKLVR
jgi:hypothetical protein